MNTRLQTIGQDSRINLVLLVVGLILFTVMGTFISGCRGAREEAATVEQAVIGTQEPTATQQVLTTTPTTVEVVIVDVSLPVQSQDDIAQLKSNANAFADSFFGEYGKQLPGFTILAKDVSSSDPSNSDFIADKSMLVWRLQGFLGSSPDITVNRRAMYISADSAVFKVDEDNIAGLEAFSEFEDPPPIEFSHLFHFKNGLIDNWDLWVSPSSLELLQHAAFAPGQDGQVKLENIVNRYISAWTSGDAQKIAALYRDDAVFEDTLRNIQVQGSASIAKLAQERFGPAENNTIEIVDLIVQTNGPDQPSSQFPDKGIIIAIGIHYRWTTMIDRVSIPLDGLTVFELGVKNKGSFDIDPDGLIVRERFFYNPDSLLALGDDQWIKFVYPLVSPD